MLYRHVFGRISSEFRGITRVFVNYAGFRGYTWISRLRDRAKYQKPWIINRNNFGTVIKWYKGWNYSVWFSALLISITVKPPSMSRVTGISQNEMNIRKFSSLLCPAFEWNVEHLSGNLSEKVHKVEKRFKFIAWKTLIFEILRCCNVKKNSWLYTIKKLGKSLWKSWNLKSRWQCS